MNQMPILSALLGNAPLVDVCTGERIGLPPLHKVVPFDVQVAADIYFERELQAGVRLNDYGQLRVPYPDMWMEWDGTDEAHWAAIIRPELPFAPTIFVGDSDEPVIRPDEIYFRYILFVKTDGGVGTFPVESFVMTDDQGLNVRRMFMMSVLNDDDNDIGINRMQEPNSEREKEVLQDVARAMGGPVLMALGIINCRNVSTAQTGKVGLSRSGAEKRRGLPKREIRYHTIILPGGGSVHEGASGGGRHRAASLHRVRGHFKTFTAEKPLLGRHVGTYWWGWQMRGTTESGVVVSDYKMKRQPIKVASSRTSLELIEGQGK